LEQWELHFALTIFPSLKNNNCCGFDVLKSLGIDLDGLKKHYNNPKELFTELAIEQGIIFINIAYEKLGSDEMANIKIIDEAFKINKPILEKVKQGNIVAAGTKCQQFLITKYNVRNFLAVIHPSKLNRDSENQTLRMKWKQHWDPNRLKVLLKL
jgi:hypothetical protein